MHTNTHTNTHAQAHRPCTYILYFLRHPFQLCALEHPYVVWMDASLRFNSKEIATAINSAKDLTILAAEGYGSVAVHTHQNMFNFLKEEPCSFKNLKELQTGFIIYYGNEFGERHFMLPWVSCALTFGCMVPDNNSTNYLSCLPDVELFHACHRFEQSMMSILLYKLFPKTVDKRTLKPKYYTFCRDCKT